MRNRSSSGAGGAHTGMFGYPRILMAPDDGTGSGGGGAGDGSVEDDKIPASKKDLIQLISQTVHSAFTNRAERDKKQRAKDTADAVAAALSAAGIGKKPDDDGMSGDGGDVSGSGAGQGAGQGQGGQGGAKPRSDLEIQLYKVQKELELQKKAGEEERAKREKAERASALNEELSKLRSALAERVKPELLEAAVRLTSERIVRDPDTGEIAWKGDKWSDREGADNLDNYESFDLGLQKWTDGIGKHFAPAKPVGGGGTGRAGSDGKIKAGNDGADDETIGQILTGAMFNRRG